MSYDLLNDTARRGVWLERDFGRLRVGADVSQGRALLRAGFVW